MRHTASAFDLPTRLSRGSGFESFTIRVFTARQRYPMTSCLQIERNRPSVQGFLVSDRLAVMHPARSAGWQT